MRLPKTTLAVCLLTAASAAEIKTGGANLITHEWGTFTTVADNDGNPVKWLPLSGPADLPCFVSRFNPLSPKGFPGLVRMETPVLYFYAQQPMTLSVRVQFPQGWITEVYPNVSSVKPASMTSQGASQSYRGGAIEWNSVEVTPDANPELPVTKAANHYFAARETDAAPVRVGKQWEKLLFYRGIGDFEVPLRPAFTSDGKLRIRNAGAEPIPLVILFENRGGKLGYRVKWGLRDAVEFGATGADRLARSASPGAGERSGGVRPVPARGAGDGGDVARLVVRGGNARLLHRSARAGGRYSPVEHHARAVVGRPCVRGKGGGAVAGGAHADRVGDDSGGCCGADEDDGFWSVRDADPAHEREVSCVESAG